ncbi:hypothetical protein G3N18_07780, partial [Microbacterium sp. 2C]|nr:hypothetical protein [Microbacterium paulum]
YGPNHGFAETVQLPTGTSTVCAYAINQGAGGNASLGCTTVTVLPTIADQGRVPFGVLEAVQVSGNSAVASGWAIDPDTASPISVHLYVGSVGKAVTADRARSDVGAAYPVYGPNHGFAETVQLPTGTSTVCAYAINQGAGGNASLGCKTVTVGG